MKEKAKPDDVITLSAGMRQEHCACGSGKRAADCCNQHAFRHIEIRIPPATYNTSDGLAISTRGEIRRVVRGKLKPFLGSGRLTVSNLRDGKRPKLTAATITGADVSWNPDHLLFQFQHILVLDTNTRTATDVTRCATGIFQLDAKHKDAEAASLGYKPVLTVEFTNPSLSPERVGWLFAIEAIKASPHLTGRRIALLTDHDATHHDLLNSRREKIDGKCKLPANMRLIYASADRGDHAVNKLMRKADQLASRVLDRESPAETSAWMNGSAFHCEAYRLSYPDPAKGDWAISETDSIKYRHHPEGF